MPRAHGSSRLSHPLALAHEASMIHARTAQGGLVHLVSFDLRTSVLELLVELQVTIPRYLISLEDGTFIEVRRLCLEPALVAALNQTTGYAQAATSSDEERIG